MRRALACVVTLLAVLTLACQPEEERIAELRDRAKAYQEEEKWGEAKIELLNLLQLNDNDAEAHYLLAQSLAALREPGAYRQLREAVRLAPDNADWRLELARAQLGGAQRDSQENVDQLIDDDPENVDALILRSRLQGLREEFEPMLESLDAALAVDPNNEEAQSLKAFSLLLAGKTAEAETAYKRLIRIAPNAASYSQIGRFYLSEQRLEEAEDAYRKAVGASEDEDQRVLASLQLANFLVVSDNRPGAETVLVEAREASPENSDLLLALARLYTINGERDKAVGLLEERAQAAPEDPVRLLALARFHNQGSDLESALEAVDRALKVDPEYEDSKLMRADFLLQLAEQRNNEAAGKQGRQIVADVLEANPLSLNGQVTQSKIDLLDGKFEEAASLLQRVTEERPNYPVAHFLLGSAYIGRGQHDLARGEFLQTITQDPTHEGARVQLVSLYVTAKNYELAAQEAERGLALRPADTRLRLMLAESRARLRDPEQALQLLGEIDLESDAAPLPVRIRGTNLLLELGALEPAKAVVYSLLEDHPTSHDALSTLIAVEGRGGKPLEALPKLDAASEQAPENADLHRLRGQFYLQFIRPDSRTPHFPDQARGDLSESLRLNPQDSRSLTLMGRLEELLGNDTRALAKYEEALQANSSNGDAYLRKSALEERTKRNDAAVQTYDALFRAEENSGLTREKLAIARNNMAWLLSSKEGATSADLDRALELAREAKEVLTSNPAVADTLGYVMLKRGIGGAAGSLFREAIGGYPPQSQGRALARCHLAMSLEANGEVGKAIDELDASLEEVIDFPGRDACRDLLRRLSGDAASVAP